MKNFYKDYLKRVLDIIISSVVIVAIMPLMIIVAILIKLTSKGPVIFKQYRYGQNKKKFICYKFRSMHITAPQNTPTWKLKDTDKHITIVGNLLRKSSIDELPQLFNVFKGEMSLIGPRPVVLNEKKLIDEREKVGVNVLRPGISGLAQINGRDLVKIDEKVYLDGQYVKKISFKLDVQIFFKTIICIIKRKGIKEGM